jgi:hypothetical protein
LSETDKIKFKLLAIMYIYCRKFDFKIFYMIKNTGAIAEFNSFFGKQSELTLDALRHYFKIKEPDIPDTTIRWRLHEMVEAGILSRAGRGLYQLESARTYLPKISSRVSKINRFLKKQFPLISYCVWDSGLLNEFAQHLSSYQFILVDVDRDVAESVYYKLKEEFSGTFLRPSEALLNDVLPDFRLPLVVRYLTSESPLSKRDDIPVVTIEKILVDVFCDPEFYYLVGSERRAVFSNAYYKYTINENKLFRYAARKGRKEEIQEYIREGQFNGQRQ